MEFIYSNCHDRETFVVIITLSYNFMTVLSVSLFNFIGWNRTSQKQENRSELITPKPLIIYGGGGAILALLSLLTTPLLSKLSDIGIDTLWELFVYDWRLT